MWNKDDALDWVATSANLLSVEQTKNPGTSKAGWSVTAELIVEDSGVQRRLQVKDNLSSDERIQHAARMPHQGIISFWTNKRTGARSLFAPVVPGWGEDFPLFLFFIGIPGAVAALFVVGERVDSPTGTGRAAGQGRGTAATRIGL
jgi:hypothetical protein